MKLKIKHKKEGFTLAEVLITLGIIGIVAAMTLPALINNYQKKVMESQYARGVNTLSNGLKLMMTKNEVPGNLLNTPLYQCSEVKPASDSHTCILTELKKYFPIIADSKTGYPSEIINIEYNYAYEGAKIKFWSKAKPSFTTSDGIMYQFWVWTMNSRKSYILFYIDVNGPKKPNAVGEDLYAVAVENSGKILDITCHNNHTCEGDASDIYNPFPDLILLP